MKNIILLLALLSSVGVIAQEENPWCAAEHSAAQKSWLRSFQQSIPTFSGERSDLYYLPLKAHIVGDFDGKGYFRHDHLLTAVCELNENMASTGIYFYLIPEINYINNSNYYEHDFSAGQQMMYLNNEDEVVNMYFVKSIGANGGTSYTAGYYAYGPDALAMRNASSGPGNVTITHEVGHYLSLPHTFSGWEYGTPPTGQQEKVDGSNCSTAGDGFCDTSPDYAPFPWNCPSVGPFNDPDGVEFYVLDSFYMSYSQGTCKTQFSEEQRLAMGSYLESFHPYFTLNPEPVMDSLPATSLVYPPDGALNISPDAAVLRWEEVEGASHYLVSVAYSSLFTARVEEAIVEGTEYNTGLLPFNRALYWRVKPLTPGYTCADFTPVSKFTTGEPIASGIDDDNTLPYMLNIFPVPAESGAEVRLEWNSPESGETRIELVNLSGQIISSASINARQGENQYWISTENLNPGLFLVRFSSKEASMTRKLIIR